MGQRHEGLEHVGGVIDDVVLDILRGNARRRGWEVIATVAFGGGFLVIAEQGGYEVRGVGDSVADAAIAVMSQLADRYRYGEDLQLRLPLL